MFSLQRTALFQGLKVVLLLRLTENLYFGHQKIPENMWMIMRGGLDRRLTGQLAAFAPEL